MNKDHCSRIYLIGFMAAGKSTIGSQLADKLNVDFMDTDQLISETVGLPIPDIFARYGETYFRWTEAQVVRTVSQKKDMVIALGGGAPMYYDTMALLNRTGTTIFIDVPFDTILDRLQNLKDRPLANEMSKSDLHDLLESRIPVYSQAQLSIEALEDVESMVNEILKKLKKG